MSETLDLQSILNDKQIEAAKIIEGPVMVFAGAGTGKTRTLTYRIANMVSEGIAANSILAITFTNKATNEMRERLDKILGPSAKALTISTFHSLCARILRRDIEVLGYLRSFEIIDEEDQIKWITEAMKNLNIDKKKITPKHMRRVINDCKCFNMKPSFEDEQRIFNEYERVMMENNLLDFEDLLIKTYQLFSEHQDVLEKYRYAYRYVLVDEFQDTNLIQYKIAKLLTEDSRNLFVVGDDDQSIYSFRGTNYENMKLFKRDFPEYKMVILDENYRSTQTILDGANNLISNNEDRERKSLFSKIEGSANDVEVNQAYDDREEVNFVCTKIRELNRKGVPFKEMAVLYRSSVVSRNFELAFVQENIPYRIFGGVSYLRRKEIKDLMAYLRLILNHNDVNNFKRIVNVPSRGIGEKTIEKIIEFKKDNKLSLFDSINALKDSLGNKYIILQGFVNTILELEKLLDVTPLNDFYDLLLDKTNFLESIKDDDDEEERKENIDEFKTVLANIEDNGEIASRREKLIGAFDEAILADDKLANQKQRMDGVTLSTVHSVKGLEFDTVFIVAFEDGIFPNLGFFEDVNIEEERRITYVACTRAKRHLYLTCAKRRMLYGRLMSNSQSMFLLEFIKAKVDKLSPKDFEKDDFNVSQISNEKELGFDDFFEPKAEKKETKQEVSEEIATDPKDYKIGDMVNHKIYGNGIVVSLEDKFGSVYGKICFTEKGTIKTFDMAHPSIRKCNK